MTTKIFLIRHAEAEGNLFRVAHGQYDSTITPRGYQQLAYLRERFANEQIDAVYGSDLTRTWATASAVYVPKGLAFQPLPLLREIRLGVWEQKTWGEILRMDRQMYIDFNKRPDLWCVEGAETFGQVRERMLSGIRQIAAAHPGGTVAATSHGAALRTLLGTLQDDASHLPASASTFGRQSWHKSDAATEPGLWFRPAGGGLEACLDDEVVGKVAMAQEPGRVRITAYEVLPAMRGRGYGVQLLGQAVQYARSQDRETLVLNCSQALAGYFAQYGFTHTAGDEMVMDLRRVIRDIPQRGQ